MGESLRLMLRICSNAILYSLGIDETVAWFSALEPCTLFIYTCGNKEHKNWIENCEVAFNGGV